MENGSHPSTTNCSGSGCNSVTCCSQQCLLTNTLAVCAYIQSSNAYYLVTSLNYCENECQGVSITYKKCGSQDCFQSDCDLHSCNINTDTHLCDQNNVYYPTRSDFCNAATNAQLTDRHCPECRNNNDCCLDDCDLNQVFPGAFCASFDQAWVPNKLSFCQRHCNSISNAVSCLASNANCTDVSCCQDLCQAQINANPSLNIPVLYLDPTQASGYSGLTSACHANCSNILIAVHCQLN